MSKNTIAAAMLCLPMLAFNVASAQSLNTVESVEYDAINQRFLASNQSNIIEVDGNGNEVAYFGTDPEASYGMEIMGDALYAISGNDINAYDLTTGALISNVTISGAQFLNGMASDGDHRIWVTDFSSKKIYEIDFTNLLEPTYVLVVSNTITTPNGICYDPDNNRLVFVNWGSNAKIKAVDLAGYALTTLYTFSGTGNCDGIDNDNYGNFFVSSWTPNKITKFSNEFSVLEVITVAGGLSSPADICYAEEIDTLAISNSGNSTIVYVGFTSSGVEVSDANPFAFACYPNPLTDKSVLTFRLTEPGITRIEILDTHGRVVEVIMEENLGATIHKIVLGDIELSAGNYIWHVTSGDESYSEPFVK